MAVPAGSVIAEGGLLVELQIRDGDYVPDQAGGLRRLSGSNALLQRVLFRLIARRGTFPFWETLGSRLWELGRLPASERQAAARQYDAEALADAGDGRASLTAELICEGGTLSVAVSV